MSNERNEELQLSGTILTQGQKAALVDFGDGVEAWMPYSQCSSEVQDYDKGDDILFTAPRWLIEAKELENYVLD